MQYILQKRTGQINLGPNYYKKGQSLTDQRILLGYLTQACHKSIMLAFCGVFWFGSFGFFCGGGGGEEFSILALISIDLNG